MDKITSVKGLATKTTLNIPDYGLRAVADMVKVPLQSPPTGDAHADLASDLFLNAYTDEVSPKTSVVAGRELNQQLMQWVRDNSEDDSSNHFNMPAAMFSSAMTWLHVSNDEVIAEALKKQDAAADKHKNAEQLDMIASGLMSAYDESGDTDMLAQANRFMELAKDARDVASKMADDAIGVFEDDAKDNAFKQAGIHAAATDAAQATENFTKAAAGWGMGPGDDIFQDPTAVMKFIQNNQGKMAQLAILAGRLKGFVLEGRKEQQPTGSIPTDVDITRNIPRLLPSEKIKLAPQMPDVVRFTAVNQLVSQGLLGITPSGEHDTDGSVVCATDVSPSMHGSRELVAKALSLAVGFVKKKDGKPYFLFNFASNPRTMKHVCHTDSLDAHFQWARHSSLGGTNFDMALIKAVSLLCELPDKGKNADLLFHSDGEAKVSKDTIAMWHEFKNETGARLFYVPIGKSYYQDMELLADKVYHLSELTETTGIDLAQAIGRWLR